MGVVGKAERQRERRVHEDEAAASHDFAAGVLFASLQVEHEHSQASKTVNPHQTLIPALGRRVVSTYSLVEGFGLSSQVL